MALVFVFYGHVVGRAVFDVAAHRVASFYNFGGHAGDNHAWRYIVGNYRGACYYASFPDAHARKDEDFGADNRTFLQMGALAPFLAGWMHAVDSAGHRVEVHVVFASSECGDEDIVVKAAVVADCHLTVRLSHGAERTHVAKNALLADYGTVSGLEAFA